MSAKPKRTHPQIETLKRILASMNLDYAEEHRFHPVRKWRFDLAVPSRMLAIEYHGHAGFVGGKSSGHSTIKGLTNDCEKLSTAQAMGWKVLSFTAMHFDARKRITEKLTDPYSMIEMTLNNQPIK